MAIAVAAPASADGGPDTGSLPGGVLGGTFEGLGDPFETLQTVGDVVRDAAGRWLVGANVFSAAAVARYRTDGTLDPSFGVGGYARVASLGIPRVDLVAELIDGRIVAGGVNSLPTVFGPDGVSQGLLVAGLVTAEDLEPLPDGRLLVIGREATRQVLEVVNVASVPSASSATRWELPVLLPEVSQSRLALDAAGRVFLTNCSLVATDPRCVVLAFAPSGEVDASFGVGGVLALTDGGVEPLACAVDASPDGYLVTACGTPAGVLVRTFDPTGRLERSFAPSLLPGNDTGIRVAVEGTGRAFVSTTVEVSPSRRDAVVVAFLSDGSVDTGFGTAGVVTAAAGTSVTGLRVDPLGGVYAFGNTPVFPNVRWWLSAFEAPAGPALQPPLVRTARFVPVSPVRVLDTRAGVGRAGTAPPTAGETVVLDLSGVAPAPRSGVTAVVLNLTATEALAPGFVTAWPAGGGRPTVSNLNVERTGQTVANLAVVPLGPGGDVAVYTQTGTHLVADVAGWFVAVPTATAGRYVAAPVPHRVLDTRVGTGAVAGLPPAGSRVDVRVLGAGPVPADGVSAVVLNLTGTEAPAAGYVTAWPGGQERPLASVLNLDANGTRANLVMVPVGADGTVSLFTQNGAHLIADVAGWYTDGTAPDTGDGLFVAVPPRRMLDTRIAPGALPAGGTVTRRIGATAVVPGGSASAVIANLTATESQAAGYVTATAAGVPLPLASNLNLERAGSTVPNLAVVGVGGDAVTLYTQSGAHLILDVAGWFT